MSLHFNKNDQEVFLEGLRMDCDNKLDHAVLFCDIDGPLLDCRGRLSYLEKKEYDKFYGCEMANDTAHCLYSTLTLALISGLISVYGINNFKLVFNTSRPERTRALTELVLGREFTELLTVLNDTQREWERELKMLMRKDNDWRKASEIKLENVTEWLRLMTKEVPATDTDIFIVDDDKEVLQIFDGKFKECAKEYEVLSLFPQPVTVQIGRRTNYSELSKSYEE